MTGSLSSWIRWQRYPGGKEPGQLVGIGDYPPPWDALEGEPPCSGFITSGKPLLVRGLSPLPPHPVFCFVGNHHIPALTCTGLSCLCFSSEILSLYNYWGPGPVSGFSDHLPVSFCLPLCDRAVTQKDLGGREAEYCPSGYCLITCAMTVQSQGPSKPRPAWQGIQHVSLLSLRYISFSHLEKEHIRHPPPVLHCKNGGSGQADVG